MMNHPIQLDNQYLQHIFNAIQDGIIVMDENRKILSLNKAARDLTGWYIGDHVPYCSYCNQYRTDTDENKCYLIARQEVPYFLSEMPTYQGKKIDVEMSTALIFQGSKTRKKEYLLVLRDQSLRKREEEAILSKKMIQMLIEARESEHKRLAQELHDGVGQALYSISVALQAVESFVEDTDVSAYIQEVRKELEKVMNDVKTYAYQLRPKSLDNLGLIATVQELISSLNKINSQITFTFDTNVEEVLPSLISINLYRVIQEATLNIIKYAKATKAEVKLLRSNHELVLTVQDNGVGFNVKEAKQYGLGLKHMEERIHQIGGTFEISSAKGEGTFIKATITEGEITNDKSDGRR